MFRFVAKLTSWKKVIYCWDDTGFDFSFSFSFSASISATTVSISDNSRRYKPINIYKQGTLAKTSKETQVRFERSVYKKNPWATIPE